MSLQYITDSKGQTTGVFIPIKEWNKLKSKYKVIEQEDFNIPEWHKEIVRKRMEIYKNDPEQAMDFDAAMDEIEKSI